MPAQTALLQIVHWHHGLACSTLGCKGGDSTAGLGQSWQLRTTLDAATIATSYYSNLCSPSTKTSIYLVTVYRRLYRAGDDIVSTTGLYMTWGSHTTDVKREAKKSSATEWLDLPMQRSPMPALICCIDRFDSGAPR